MTGKVSTHLKSELRPFLAALPVANIAGRGNALKGQMAQAYYKGKNPGKRITMLVGAIDGHFHGPARIKVFMKMLATLPCPDLETINWLTQKHPFFNGDVRLTSEAIVTLWLEDNYGYGDYTHCELHGWQKVIRRSPNYRGVTYHDHTWDSCFFEELACGCEIRGDHYHEEDTPRKYWHKRLD